MSLVSKEGATAEIVNSGCVGALLTCLNNIKRAEKSSVCIFECVRCIMKDEVVKLEFTRNDGIVTVARHLVDMLALLSKTCAAADEEVYINSSNHSICTFLELCNIDLARSQFANIGVCLFVRVCARVLLFSCCCFACTHVRDRPAPVSEGIYCSSSKRKDGEAAHEHR